MNDERLPEHNSEAEWMLVACCIEKSEIIPMVDIDHFYLQQTREVFTRILDLHVENRVDAINVPQSFFRNQVLLEAVTESLQNLPSPEGWQSWFELCDELRVARKASSLSARINQEISTAINGGRRFDISEFVKEFSHLQVKRKFLEDDIDYTQSALEEIEAQYGNPDALMGLKTGYRLMDRLLQGFHPGDMIVLAARPAMGKTSLAMNLVQNICLENKNETLMFSLEMSETKLRKRLLFAESQIDPEKITNQDLSENDFKNLHRATIKVKQAPLKISDRASDLSDIIATVTERSNSDNVKLIVVDYIQRIQLKSSREGRQFQVAAISAAMKDIAMQTGACVLALAQISRDVEKYERRPKLSDLRDSGQLEQDADAVCFLHPTEERDPGKPTQNIDLIIEKNRSGPIGVVPLTFRLDITRFYERQREF